MNGIYNRMTFTNSFSVVNTVSGDEQSVTINGLVYGRDEVISIRKATHQAGLVISGAFVSADNTLKVRFANGTAGNITPTAGDTYTLVLGRFDSAPVTSVNL